MRGFMFVRNVQVVYSCIWIQFRPVQCVCVCVLCVCFGLCVCVFVFWVVCVCVCLCFGLCVCVCVCFGWDGCAVFGSSDLPSLKVVLIGGEAMRADTIKQ
jgi:hypothetical protein